MPDGEVVFRGPEGQMVRQGPVALRDAVRERFFGEALARLPDGHARRDVTRGGFRLHRLGMRECEAPRGARVPVRLAAEHSKTRYTRMRRATLSDREVRSGPPSARTST